MTPSAFAQSRDLVLVDVRPEHERRSDAGFLPASLGLPPPQWDAPDGTLAMLGTLDETRGIVVYCTSGRRSEEARRTLATRTALPIWNLDGGALGWAAEGLPVCRPIEDPTDLPTTPLELRRRLLACFVGANAELSLDRGVAPEPTRVLAECFRRANVRWDDPSVEGLYRVLDWSAIVTYRSGGRLADIAENLGRMVGSVAALERRMREARASGATGGTPSAGPTAAK